MTGIIVLNYNNARLTIDCLESVRMHNSYPCKFIVVDNASSDDSLIVLRREMYRMYSDDFTEYNEDAENISELKRYSLVSSKENGGYAKGNNVGLRLAEADNDIDTILILNNDILFTEDILPDLVSFLETREDIGIVSPLLLKKDGRQIDYNCARKDCSLKEIAFYYLLYCSDYKGILTRFARERMILLNDISLLQDDSVPVELPSGSCMLINKSLFKQIGYFDPNTFLYYEEGILYRKLLKLNKVNYVLPKSRCIHLGAQSTTKIDRSYSYLRHSNRSAYYYVTHYRKLNLLQRLCFMMLYAAYNCLLFIKQQLNRLKL